MLRKTEGKRKRRKKRMRMLDSISNLTDINLSKLREIVKDRVLVCYSPWVCKELDTT